MATVNATVQLTLTAFNVTVFFRAIYDVSNRKRRNAVLRENRSHNVGVHGGN